MCHIEEYVEQVTKAARFLETYIPDSPHVAIQFGTELGGLLKHARQKQVINYSDIPFFPTSTGSCTKGKIIIGSIHTIPVIILSGRLHYYDGYSTKEMTFPIRVLRLLGIKTLIVTNTAWGVNPLFLPGTIMVMRDHLNFLGENPLEGPNVDEWGPRFPDLSEPYHPALIKIALDSASSIGIKKVVTGTYACIPGPSISTPAENHWLRYAGSDAVGMSSVPETIVAIHGSMQVLGLSVVTHVHDPDNISPVKLQGNSETAASVEPQLVCLVIEILQRMFPPKV